MPEVTAPPKPAAPASPWTRQNPFPGKLIVNRRLSSGDSEKDTRHFEIDLTNWGLNFEPGDSVAVYPTNDPNLVNEILRSLGAIGDEQVTAGKTHKALREALLRDFSITQPTPKFLKAIAGRASAAPMLRELLHPDRKNDLQNYLWGVEVIDFLLDHPSAKFAPEEFVGLLTKLQPRLYSVGSSLKVFPSCVHLIVDVVQYESRGRIRKGVCSTFLAERADKVPVPVYPSLAKHFHMPQDQSAPLIMVGPGTGVAPFRAFLQERQAVGAKGKNWLFFGAQREKCDYAYKEDWEKFTRDGILTRLDCAWSRDQAHKIYVQNKMLEHAAEIWKWMDGEGAQFFVCGDARRMAKDVDAALRKIVQEQGGKSVDEANAYVEKLKTDKRYKRDVY
ncbi:MAG TPA: sulfite reductase subunit alpha [Chthoniobacterales bacterium]|jgi:sulfite reductase (NADPH) flavoprotein alpha-component|nr:sulfite reductase subunit alpha [Chthoniobacterales bacterium]